jgi:hypothetical protein
MPVLATPFIRANLRRELAVLANPSYPFAFLANTGQAGRSTVVAVQPV